MAGRIAKPPPMHIGMGELPPLAFEKVGGVAGDRYLHWDQMRSRTPPDGLTHEQWWTTVRLMRSIYARPIALLDKDGTPFCYSIDPVLERLHHLDLRATGRLAAPAAVVDQTTRDRYAVRGLIEEALSSSQIEGAATTRRVAKEMLRSGRRPRDRSERMIFNNYRAIRHVKEIVNQDLTPDVLLEIHDMLTEGTMDDPADCGRFQQPGEPRVAVVDRAGDVVHQPPSAAEIPERIDRLCEFANEIESRGPFIHPMLRAVMLHFWLAYVHPFADGNGRTARALFYWSALRAGYWLTEFISISEVILRARSQYGRAFVYVETDSGDLTYFLIHQVGVLEQAFDGLARYVDETLERTRAAERVAGNLPGLNHRQRALLGHALRNPGARYTYRSHATSHGVVRQTARTDLFALMNQGLLDRGQEGRQVTFIAPEDLTTRLSIDVSLKC